MAANRSEDQPINVVCEVSERDMRSGTRDDAAGTAETGLQFPETGDIALRALGLARGGRVHCSADRAARAGASHSHAGRGACRGYRRSIVRGGRHR